MAAEMKPLPGPDTVSRQVADILRRINVEAEKQAEDLFMKLTGLSKPAADEFKRKMDLRIEALKNAHVGPPISKEELHKNILAWNKRQEALTKQLKDLKLQWENEDLKKENDDVRDENKKLRAENRKLKAKIKSLKRKAEN